MDLLSETPWLYFIISKTEFQSAMLNSLTCITVSLCSLYFFLTQIKSLFIMVSCVFIIVFKALRTLIEYQLPKTNFSSCGTSFFKCLGFVFLCYCFCFCNMQHPCSRNYKTSSGVMLVLGLSQWIHLSNNNHGIAIRIILLTC